MPGSLGACAPLLREANLTGLKEDDAADDGTGGVAIAKGADKAS